MTINAEDVDFRAITTPNKGFIYPRPMPPLNHKALMLIQVCNRDEPLVSQVVGISGRDAKDLAEQGIPFVQNLEEKDRATINEYFMFRCRSILERMDAKLFGNKHIESDSSKEIH